MVFITCGSVSHGDTIPEDLEEDYFPPNFKEYMLKEQLKWSRHTRVHFQCSYFGWVFWSEPSLSLVEYNIRHALQKLIQQSWSDFSGSLVQFWAATKTLEGRTKLTTQYQPFALGSTRTLIDRQHLCEYRMKMCSSEYNNCFYADANSGEEQLGIPGRVFLHKYPESTPDVKYYSKKEYPQLDDAIQCSIRGSWALPVFEYSSRTCVGVLEMVSPHSPVSDWHEESFLRNMHDIFQEFGLLCFDGYTHCEKQCRDANDNARTTAFQELNMVLRSVCEIRKLPLAMTWVPCSSCNDILRGQLMSEVLEYVEQEDTDEDFSISKFLEVGKFSHLRKGGVSERALSSPYMLYCSDITQLSIAEYPLVPCARLCNFRALFTICLQSSYTDKEVYVVDFFLPTCSKDDEFILTTLSLILGTMEEKFKTFTLASGQQLGEEVWVELMDFRNGQMIQLPSPQLLKDRRLMLQIGQLDQPSTDAIHSGMNVISEEQNYIFPSLPALQNGEATMQLDSPHQPPLDPSNYGHNVVVIAEQNMLVVTSSEQGTRKRQEREHKRAGVRIEISLEDILKCSEMSQKNAARELKVSPYKLRRVCREQGIPRWPPRKINMVCSSRPLPVEDQNQSPKMNSNTASDQASACVANINLGFQDADMASDQAQACVAKINLGFQDADMVTIKAKYAEYTLKFRLSSSPRLLELQEEVGKRLKLEAETYYVQYEDEDEDEEKELILIACDEDLQACVRTSISLGRTSTLVLLKPKPPITM